MADFSQAAASLLGLVEWGDAKLWASVAATAWCPTFWNIAARREHRTRFMSKALGGAYPACYTMAATIFTFSLVRDWVFNVAIDSQPSLALLDTDNVKLVAAGLLVVGNVLVGSTYLRLGITGTYLGDYFGILMKERVTGFPFSVFENPMYLGSTLNFLSLALYKASPAGIFLTGVVYAVYQAAIAFEGPFTSMIYAEDAAKASKKTN